jgi:hypothetical protein
VDECKAYTPPGTYLVRAHVCRGCRFAHDLEFAYQLPNRDFSECWVFCLVYKSLECVAIEFEPDDRGKATIEDTDKGTCYIQRRSSVSVSVVKDAYRNVYMPYQDEPEQALMTSVLASNMRVNTKLLRYHSVCNASSGGVVKGVCKNTHGSFECACVEGYIPSPGNGSCVKAGEIGTYMPAFQNGTNGTSEGEDYDACPKGAWTLEGAASLEECYCASGSHMRVTSWSNSTQECGQCGAGLWSNVNSTCETCYPNSWSLPGTVRSSNCLCNPGFYMDVDALQKLRASANKNVPFNASAGGNMSSNVSDAEENMPPSGPVEEPNQCASVRGTEASPCVSCPRFSNTSGAATSIWDCKCNPSYVRVIDPGDPTTFVCVPEDRCTADMNPCPGGGTAVCKSSPYEFEYQCQCNPGEGYADRSLVGGFCLKMWYFNSKVDLGVILHDRRVNVYALVQAMEIASTQNLRDMVTKSRSKMFGRGQSVVVEFAGTMVVDELAFYEVCMFCACMCRYACVCML